MRAGHDHLHSRALQQLDKRFTPRVNMAQRKQLSQATVVLTKYKVFNELCLAYRRSKNPVYLRADDVRKELVIAKDVFADALDSFIKEGQMAVEVVESNGERYLRLSESARENCD
jgi:hypothetical protein